MALALGLEDWPQKPSNIPLEDSFRRHSFPNYLNMSGFVVSLKLDFYISTVSCSVTHNSEAHTQIYQFTYLCIEQNPLEDEKTGLGFHSSYRDWFCWVSRTCLCLRKLLLLVSEPRTL